MTNNEPEFKNLADTPVQLCLFYNSRTREISFASTSPDSFFEISLNLQQHPPFLKAFEETDADFLMAEWQSCLHLKEKEIRSFTIGMTGRENPLNFSFTVVRPSFSLLSDPSLLVISVTKTNAIFFRKPENKSLSLLSKEYTEFIELAAHDLDSPLRKLSMLIERITSKYENIADKDIQGYVLRTQACLSDMRLLIENLSLLASLGNPLKKKVYCNIESIIQTALKELPDIPGEKKVVIPIGPLPVIEGDSTQYKQLFRNILENAFKFKKKEIPAKVEIFTEPVTDKEKQLHGLPCNNLYFKISILDKGIGFRQEYAEKIFLPFVRLNGKSEYPGSGIGLAICNKIVENHCGIIYAEGYENIGAKFTLLLPFKS